MPSMCVPESWATGVIATKPGNMTYEQATAVPIGGMTALYLLKQADLKRGQKALIYGASGSVGTYGVQLAKYFGAEVTAVCSGKNIDLVKSLGADMVIDYTIEDFTKSGKTFDVILDAVGKISQPHSKGVLASNGHYVTIKSSTHEATEALICLRELIDAGPLRAVIDWNLPIEQIAEAYRREETRYTVGNVVITGM